MEPKRFEQPRGLPYSIVDLMKSAHRLGQQGTDFDKVLELTGIDAHNPKAYAMRYVLILLTSDYVDWDDAEQRGNLFYIFNFLRDRFERRES